MNKGINRAHLDPFFESSLFESNHRSRKKCIFISHKYEDLKAAIEVAEYIMLQNIDVYLDDKDLNLQKAVKEQNSEKIVSCIEKGISHSTDILVLVTENTRQSWWVPYETGYAKMGQKGIASLLLKKADEFPDYLKIETTLYGFHDLAKYVTDLMGSAPVMESILQEQNQRNRLLEYIKE